MTPSVNREVSELADWTREVKEPRLMLQEESLQAQDDAEKMTLGMVR